jgi:hypothetical protein
MLGMDGTGDIICGLDELARGATLIGLLTLRIELDTS